ncbi:Transducin/WD-40 repeat family protein [Quillaja saponaria]|uniref:Transducin/WD-40 repeat family protein n=1 Tax=Quillaja saponaria TaxID=32244 RepID=A0AAD7Q0H4_QUISA|nr:Transducin/WD-40 repeat family protein [Quillaja saponaria]KAJ7972567.1 Transducin/WD-40 repeat family protein [Quillaja saponaria]
MTRRSRPHDQTFLASPSSNYSRGSGRNVFHLLAQREISPRTKHVPKRQWGESSKKSGSVPGPKSEAARDARCGLLSWVEAESLRHLAAKYCPLLPPPRSTIAAAFSPDGKVLASTHGDHTVKIVDCQSGNCLKVLIGHRRTPWVVRFHPLHPDILASGSLDQDVCLWDTNTSECIVSHHFYRPIASIAFHAQGEILAVASGHKLYIWHYNKRGEVASPTFVLKTRRSLRAVHFHPHGAPYLLTAEVNDLDSSDTSMTQAVSLGYLHYPPPAIFVANEHPRKHSLASELPFTSLPFLFRPSNAQGDSRIELEHANRDVNSSIMQVDFSASVQSQKDANVAEKYDSTVSPTDPIPDIPSGGQNSIRHTSNTSFSNGVGISPSNAGFDGMETDERQPVEERQYGNSTNVNTSNDILHVQERNLRNHGVFAEFLPSRDPAGWELSFLQGWVMGQNQASLHSMLPHMGVCHDHLAHQGGSSTVDPLLSNDSLEAATASLALPGSIGLSGTSGSSSMRNHVPHSQVSVFDSGNVAASTDTPYDGTDIQTIISRIQSELATSVTAAELPCTVKLRVWLHDIKDPCAPLTAERCQLTIPHAVLCSEMGAHFSPCGRFLAACVACVFPHMESDPGLPSLVHQEPGAATSPTQHPISVHQVIYELRIYSLEKATFGSVLVSRAIRAAHCLTSIQFSPTSEHILLAYGRRHGSLLKSIVIDGETTLPIYTVLEVYRVSDMELVRVLPSSEDEVNVACFHPFAGGGLVYGTKEGKLRVLQYDGADVVNNSGPIYFPDDNAVGVA